MKNPLRFILSFLLFCSGLAHVLAQSERTWTGEGLDANWTTAGNWDVLPEPEDILVFDGSTQTTNTNDFTAGTQFDGITFQDTADSFTLNGNAIALNGNIFVSSNPASFRTHTLNMDLDLLAASTTITTRGNADIILNGIVSGNSDITKAAAGTLRLTGDNSFTGNWHINAGGVVEVSSIANSGVNSNAGAGDTFMFGHVASAAPAILRLADATSAQSTDRQIFIGEDIAGAARDHHARIENTSGSGNTLTFTNSTFNIAQTEATAARTLSLGGTNTGANMIEGVIQDNNTGGGGTVSVVKNDEGTWALSAINTYTGGTLISGGVLEATSDHRNFGANDPNNLISLDGGTMRWSAVDGNFIVAQRGINVMAGGGTIDVTDPDGRVSINNAPLTGAGTLTITGLGEVVPTTDISGFSGDWDIDGGEVWAITAQDSGAEALGTGDVNLSNNGRLLFSGSGSITFTQDSALGSGGGQFILGQGSNANPTVTWNGVIVGSGDLTIANFGGATGQFIMGGQNTYSGNTTIDSGSTLSLADGGALTFVIGANGVNNQLEGGGDLELDGEFAFDLDNADFAEGNEWTIITSALLANTQFGGTFSVRDFLDQEDGTWTSDDPSNPHFIFDTGTGVLTAVPEPATYAFLGGLLAFGAVLVRHRMK